MPIFHFCLVLLVVIIWGLNFLFVKLSLNEISPLLLCTLRFTLASIPAVFFIRPSKVPFKVVTLYGLIMFALQFSLLFMGMHVGMTPGMASVIMQVQVFFSMFFAALLLGEWPNIWQIIGAIISFSGIGLVAMHFDNNISLLGFVLILASAGAWGIGNLITKQANQIDMVTLIAWGSFIASFPMLILSLLVEGTDSIIYTYHHLTWVGSISLLYIVYVSTWIGYGVWNWLLRRHPIGIIVPFALLIPIVGILSSVLILDEPLHPWKLIAGVLVIGGLAINLLGMRFFAVKTTAEN